MLLTASYSAPCWTELHTRTRKWPNSPGHSAIPCLVASPKVYHSTSPAPAIQELGKWVRQKSAFTEKKYVLVSVLTGKFSRQLNKNKNGLSLYWHQSQSRANSMLSGAYQGQGVAMLTEGQPCDCPGRGREERLGNALAVHISSLKERLLKRWNGTGEKQGELIAFWI